MFLRGCLAMTRSDAAWMLREEARTISSGDRMGEAMSMGADALDAIENLQEMISAITLGRDIGISRITEIIQTIS